jgi:hypothetical protein
VTDKGAVVNFFENASAAQSNRPYAREEVSTRSDGNRIIESKSFYVFDESSRAQRCKQTEVSLDKTTGQLTLKTIDATGREDSFAFDKDGKALSMSIHRQDGSYTFTLVDGHPTKVSRDGQELSGDTANLELQKAEVALAAARKELGLSAQSDIIRELRPTSPDAITDRNGAPTGTLVWRDYNGSLRESRVEKGDIKTEDGWEFGKVTNAGIVVLSDGRTFDIAQTEGAAFHGIASDGKRLDLVSEESRTGFSGTFTSPDKKQTIAVIGNHMYDQSGKFLGLLASDGSVERTSLNSNDYQAINSFRDGWTFEGEEGGKKRIFTTSSETVNGKIFIPEKPGAPPTRYDVCMGMLINSQTGEQCGWVSSPREKPDGTLEGGSLVRMTENGLQELPLAAFRGAVFEFSRLGGTGVETVTIKGVALGAEAQADGQLREGQGFFNITAAVDQENRRAQAAQNSLTKLRDSDGYTNWRSWTGGQQESMEHEQAVIRECKRNSTALQAVLNSGEMNAALFQQMQNIQASTEVALAGSHLQAARNHLDHSRSNLEALPEDTSTLNGSVKMRRADGSFRTCEIRGGQLFDANSAHPGEPVGAILANDGTMVMMDERSGKPITTAIKYIPGATWHFDLPDGKSCDWISLGTAGIASRADLIERANRELGYAHGVHAQSDSVESAAYLAATTRRSQRYLQHLDEVFSGGVRSDDDLKFVMDGPGKHICSDQLAHKSDGPTRIELTPLNTKEEVATVNGDLRIGDQVYFIRSGQLFHHTGSATEPAPGEKPCGELLPGYRVALGENEANRRVLDLADQNRVLMQFTSTGSSEQHQIVGLGLGGQSVNQGFLTGGLLDVRELDRQAGAHLAQARAGNADYINNTPYATAALGELVLEDRGEMLQQFVGDVSKHRAKLNENLQTLFANGFDTSRMENSQLDNSVRYSQALLHCMGMTASDTDSLSREGQQIQAQVNNGVTMIAITVATAGMGSVFTGLASTARVVQLGRVGQGLMLAGEITASGLAGGTVSTLMRASNNSSASRNFASGFVEGGLMSIANIGGRAIGGSVGETREALAAARSGATLSARQTQLLSSATGRLLASEGEHAVAAAYAMQAAYRVTNATMQGTGFMIAGNIRQGNQLLEGVDAHSVMFSAGTALAGDLVGNGLSRVMRSDLARAMVENQMSGFTSGTLDGIQVAMQEQDTALAERLGVPVGWLSDETKRRYRDWGAVLEQAAQTGAMNAFSAPLVTALSHASSSGGHALVRGGHEPGHQQSRPSSNRPDGARVRADEGHGAVPGPRTRPGSANTPDYASTDSPRDGQRTRNSNGRTVRVDGPSGAAGGPHRNPIDENLMAAAVLPDIALIVPPTGEGGGRHSGGGGRLTGSGDTASGGTQSGSDAGGSHPRGPASGEATSRPDGETVVSRPAGTAGGNGSDTEGTRPPGPGSGEGTSKPGDEPGVGRSTSTGTADASVAPGTNHEAASAHPPNRETDPGRRAQIDDSLTRLDDGCPRTSDDYVRDAVARGAKRASAETQQRVFGDIQTVLNEKQGNAPSLAEQGWRVYQPAQDSAADAAKMDFVLINEHTGEYHFFDASERDKVELARGGGPNISGMHEDALILCQGEAAKERTSAIRERIEHLTRAGATAPLNAADFPPPSPVSNGDPQQTLDNLQRFADRLRDRNLGDPATYDRRVEYANEISRAIEHYRTETAKTKPEYAHYNDIFGRRVEDAVDVWIDELTTTGGAPRLTVSSGSGPTVSRDKQDTVVWKTRLSRGGSGPKAELEHQIDRDQVSRKVETAIADQLKARRKEERAINEALGERGAREPREQLARRLEEIEQRIADLERLQADWARRRGTFLNSLGDFVAAELRNRYKGGSIAESEEPPNGGRTRPATGGRRAAEEPPRDVPVKPRIKQGEESIDALLSRVATSGQYLDGHRIPADNSFDPEVATALELVQQDEQMHRRYTPDTLGRMRRLKEAYASDPVERERVNRLLRWHQEERGMTIAIPTTADATGGGTVQSPRAVDATPVPGTVPTAVDVAPRAASGSSATDAAPRADDVPALSIAGTRTSSAPPPSGTAPSAVDAPPPSGTAPSAVDAPPPSGTAPRAVDAPPPSGTAPRAVDAPPPSGTAPRAVDAPPPSGTAPRAVDAPPPSGTAPRAVDAPPPSGTAPRAVDAPPPGDQIRQQAAPPPGDQVRQQAAPPPVDQVRRQAAPPPGDQVRQQAAPPPGDQVRRQAAPPPGDQVRQQAAPPPGDQVRRQAAPPPADQAGRQAVPRAGGAPQAPDARPRAGDAPPATGAQRRDVARPAQPAQQRRKEPTNPCTVHRDIDQNLDMAAKYHPDLQGHEIKNESRPDGAVIKALEDLEPTIASEESRKVLKRTLKEYKEGNETTVAKVNQFFNWHLRKPNAQ